MSAGTAVETRSIVVRTAGQRFWVTYKVAQRDILRAGGTSVASMSVVTVTIAVRTLLTDWEIWEADGTRVSFAFDDIDRVPVSVLRAIVQRVLDDQGAVLEREELPSGVEQ